MLEQFIDGPEFSVEIIIWEKEIHILAVTDKKPQGSHILLNWDIINHPALKNP